MGNWCPPGCGCGRHSCMTPEERFWIKVDRSGDCWLWTGITSAKGYGRFSLDGRMRYSHHVVYQWVHGVIPSGQEVGHRATCPKNCVKPEHLCLIVARRGADISGQVFGDLVVQARTDRKDDRGSPLWALMCSVCGEQNFRTAPDLRRGRSSCLAGCREMIAIQSPIRSLYGQYARNAANFGRVFDITFNWFADAITQDCHYCYSPPSATFKKEGSREGITYNGLDRIDSSGGYTINNIVPCCKFCNFSKGQWGVEEFNDWLMRVRTAPTVRLRGVV